ncbi:MAG: Clp protease N-terminal domain-containing protein [Thermoleophilaceae bacterium]
MPSLATLVRRAGRGSRPDDGLPSVAAIRKELDALERHHVATAITQGWSWSRVARALGVSKQAAHRKHAAAVQALMADDPASVGGGMVMVTGQARAAVGFARDEARLAGTKIVGSEHLLLGVIRAATGPVATALTAAGVTLAAARSCLQPTLAGEDRKVAAGARDTARAARRTGVSPLARACLEQSLREAVERGDRHLGLEHLLLSLLARPEGGATRTLEELQVSPARLGRELEPLIEVQ